MAKLLESTLFTSLLECGVVLLITYAISRVLKSFIRRMAQQGINHRFLANAIIAAVWVIGCIAAVSCVPGLGNLTRTLLAGSGIVAVIVGLAAQDSFGNLLSGLFITLFKPFEIGDRIRLVKSNITGFVEDITLRHTVIRTFTNSRVIVSNATINTEIIENSNYLTTVASSFVDIQISYESDVKLAMELMADIIGSHELYLDQRTPEQIAAGEAKVTVLVRGLEANGVNLRASMWTKTIDENFRACSDVRMRIMDAYKENGIEIPYNRIIVMSAPVASQETIQIHDRRKAL